MTFGMAEFAFDTFATNSADFPEQKTWTEICKSQAQEWSKIEIPVAGITRCDHAN